MALNKFALNIIIYVIYAEMFTINEKNNCFFDCGKKNKQTNKRSKSNQKANKYKPLTLERVRVF